MEKDDISKDRAIVKRMITDFPDIAGDFYIGQDCAT